MKNSKFKIQKSKFIGFTLVELLISIGLFTVVTTVIISVLFVSFRASKKSEVIVSMKQSGNATLARMVNTIRFARTLEYPMSCVPEITTQAITVSSFDNAQTTYSCPTEANPFISSNSASLIDTNVAVVDSCLFTCSQSSESDPPTIKIQFTLSAAGATDFAETTNSVPFQTSVILRNFSR